jgi:hypothetical protein
MEGYEALALTILAGFSFLYACIRKGLMDIITKAFHKWFKEHFEGEELNREFNAVNERLVEIKTHLNADRVFISQCHNGNQFTNKKQIWKISRTYEIAAAGVSYESANMQNVMAISVWDMLSGIFDPKLKKYCEKLKGSVCAECRNHYGVFKYEVGKMPESFAKVMLRNQGVEVYLQVPVTDEGTNIIGFVGVEFLDNRLNLDNPCYLCQKVSEISYYLNKGA